MSNLRIPTFEFITTLSNMGGQTVAVHLMYSVDHSSGRVMTLDHALFLASLSRPTVPEGHPLHDVIGIDEGDFWFRDGLVLPIAKDELELTSPFVVGPRRETIAFARVWDFQCLLANLDAYELQFELVGHNLPPIIEWLTFTSEAMESLDDAELKRRIKGLPGNQRALDGGRAADMGPARFCHKCGAQFRTGDRFCVRCGTARSE